MKLQQNLEMLVDQRKTEVSGEKPSEKEQN